MIFTGWLLVGVILGMSGASGLLWVLYSLCVLVDVLLVVRVFTALSQLQRDIRETCALRGALPHPYAALDAKGQKPPRSQV